MATRPSTVVDLERLSGAGIDTEVASEKGQFELRTNIETCLRDGHFDQDRMLQVFGQLASDNENGGFPQPHRLPHEMGAKGHAHVDDLIEFESRVNDVRRHQGDAVICTCDLAKFGGDTVIDIMRTHPMIIIGGILQQNPFFVPPQEFLREFHKRASETDRGALHVELKWESRSKIPIR